MEAQNTQDVDALIEKYGTKNGQGPTCQVGASKHRELIEALLARGVQFTRAEQIVIAEFGRDERVASDSMSRHHKGRCACAR